MNKIIEGMEEALAFERGEAPAARLTINGHAYVPEASLPDPINELTEHLRAIIQLTKAGNRTVGDFVQDTDRAFVRAKAALRIVTMPKQCI